MTPLDWLLVVMVAGLVIAFGVLLLYADELAEEERPQEMAGDRLAWLVDQPSVTWTEVSPYTTTTSTAINYQMHNSGTAGTKR